MQSNITFRILEFGSDLHKDSIELRREILRKPLGLDFKESDLLIESDQFHVASLIKDKLIGILVLKKMPDISNTVLKMRQVAIDKTFQGQGVGRQLVEFAEHWALENGFTEFDLHARETVLDFYLKMNYHLVGERFLEVNIPHFRMVKNLNLSTV